jgi:hypothetical protein
MSALNLMPDLIFRKGEKLGWLPGEILILSDSTLILLIKMHYLKLGIRQKFGYDRMIC